MIAISAVEIKFQDKVAQYWLLLLNSLRQPIFCETLLPYFPSKINCCRNNLTITYKTCWSKSILDKSILVCYMIRFIMSVKLMW